MKRNKKPSLVVGNPYSLLGVSRKFTPEQLVQRWRMLSRQLHPDRNGQKTTEDFAALSCAYATLSNNEARRIYDTKLDMLTAPCIKCSGVGATYKQKGMLDRTETICPECSGCGRA